jgi:GNAT superfamily N-acetyltransferase
VALAEASDLSRLVSWNLQLQEDEGASRMSTEDAEARMRRWLQGDYRATVFEHDGALGYAVFRPTDPDVMGADGVYLRQFFIARERRRQGLGSAALRLLTEQVVPGCRLVFEVLTSNPGGRSFWQSLGLEEWFTTYQRRPSTAGS